MNIDDFRYITTIADLGSFTRAAQQLFIAQPSLSQRVKHIEKTYGISIFTRDAKGVQLTKEGSCFVRHAQRILNSESDLRREIAEMHDPENKILRIGTTQFMHSYLFDTLIQRLYQEHPKMQFAFYEASSAEQQEALLSGKVDIAICYLPITSLDLNYEIIFHDSYVVVPAMGSELAGRIQHRSQINEPVPMELLKDEPFAVANSGTRLYDYISELQEKPGSMLNIQHYVKNYSMLYALAKAGMASTILYESFFDPNQEYLPYYYLEDDCELSIAVVWRKGTYLQQSAKELIRIAKELSASAL